MKKYTTKFILALMLVFCLPASIAFTSCDKDDEPEEIVKPGDGEEPGDKPGEEPGDEPGEEPGEEPGDEPGQDEPEQKDLFANFSNILGMTAKETVNFFGKGPYEETPYYQIFDVARDNVDSVVAYFYDWGYDYIYDTVVIADSFLYMDLDEKEIHDYLQSLYEYHGIDEDGWYTYTSGDDMLIWFNPEKTDDGFDVMYVDMKHLLEEDTRAMKAKVTNIVKKKPGIRIKR